MNKPFSHLYTLVFELDSPHPEPYPVTASEVRMAILRRLASLSDTELVQDAIEHFDTSENAMDGSGASPSTRITVQTLHDLLNDPLNVGVELRSGERVGWAVSCGSDDRPLALTLSWCDEDGDPFMLDVTPYCEIFLTPEGHVTICDEDDNCTQLELYTRSRFPKSRNVDHD